MTNQNAITDVRGIEVGHAQDDDALTGCTVIVCRKGALAGVDVRGSAPGTRETDLLNPINLVEKVHAVVLTGGSAYGLDAAGGVMRYLEDQKIGYSMGSIKVPIVPAAVLYDLGLGRTDVPDAAMGYRAAASASSDAPAEGNVGAGTGASVGKVRGMEYAMKAGIGTSSLDIGGDRVVAQWFLKGLKEDYPRLAKIWVDGAYSGAFVEKAAELGSEFEVVKRSDDTKGPLWFCPAVGWLKEVLLG